MAWKKTRRFLLSILLLPGALLILGAVLYSSGVAPQYLLSLASAQSGLDLSAKQFTISLQGTLRFGRVSASLPEAEHPFFIADKLEISTGGLVDLITRSHRSISRIRVTGPVLTLCEDESGDLNIAPLLSRFGNGSKNSAAAEPYSIPSIVLNKAAVHYKRLKGNTISVTELMLECRQSDDDTVAFKTTLPGQNTLYGTMNLTTFAHSLTLRIENFDALSEGLKSTLPSGFVIQQIGTDRNLRSGAAGGRQFDSSSSERGRRRRIPSGSRNNRNGNGRSSYPRASGQPVAFMVAFERPLGTSSKPGGEAVDSLCRLADWFRRSGRNAFGGRSGCQRGTVSARLV
jgi:hypothetical protein